MGRTATSVPGVRPSISLASLPTARISSFVAARCTATTDGSFETMPLPRQTSAVRRYSRAMARSFEKHAIDPIKSSVIARRRFVVRRMKFHHTSTQSDMASPACDRFRRFGGTTTGARGAVVSPPDANGSDSEAPPIEQMRKSSQSLPANLCLFGIVMRCSINVGPQSARRGVRIITRKRALRGQGRGPDHQHPRLPYGSSSRAGAKYPAQVAKQQRLKETVMDKHIERETARERAERLGYSGRRGPVVDEIGE